MRLASPEMYPIPRVGAGVRGVKKALASRTPVRLKTDIAGFTPVRVLLIKWM